MRKEGEEMVKERDGRERVRELFFEFFLFVVTMRTNVTIVVGGISMYAT